MYSKWLAGSVAAVVLTLSLVSDANAQRRARWRGGSTITYDTTTYSPGLTYSTYPAYSDVSGFTYGYNDSYRYGRRGFRRYSNYSYPGTYYGYNSPGNYITGSIPVYDNQSGGTASTLRPIVTTSGYTPQNNQALLEVRVPDPNAQVFIDGTATRQRGTDREFISPPLESGNYSYTLRVRWRDANGMHDVMRNVPVTAGATARTDFGVAQSGDRTGEEQAEPPQRLPRSKSAPNPRNPS